MTKKKEKTKIISFVSYKGGAGRSLALANIAFELSKRNKVGCIDFDIEAGGLHKIFGIGIIKDKLSLQHFLLDEKSYSESTNGLSKPNFQESEIFSDRLVINLKKDSYFFNICPEDSIKGNIFLIQALPNANLTTMINSGYNLFQNFYNLINNFKKIFDLDYLLIDCRSGLSNLGLPGLVYNDLTMIFYRWAKQHRYGTIEFIKWYKNFISKANYNIQILTVANSINPDRISESDIQKFYNNDLKKIPINNYILEEVPLLIDNEVILGRENDTENSYSKLAKYINSELCNE